MKLKTVIKKVIMEEKDPLKENVQYTKIIRKAGIDVSKIPDDEKMHGVLQMSIDPNTLGIFGLAFKTIDLKVLAGRIPANNKFKNGLIELRFTFDYEHPSGSNGYTMRVYSKDNGKTWTDYNALIGY